MPEITRRASFYAAKARVPKTMHIEIDGAIVNITVGLTDHHGRYISRVDVIPDDESRGGDGHGYVWRQPEGDARIIRQARCEHCGSILDRDDISGWIDDNGKGDCPANPDSINHETPAED